MDGNSADVPGWMSFSTFGTPYIMGFFFTTLYLWLQDHMLETFTGSPIVSLPKLRWSNFLTRIYPWRLLNPDLATYRRMVHGALLITTTTLVFFRIAPSTLFWMKMLAYVFTIYIALLGPAALGHWMGNRLNLGLSLLMGLPAWIAFIIEDFLLEPFIFIRPQRRAEQDLESTTNQPSSMESLLAKEPGELTVSDVMIPRVELPVFYETDTAADAMASLLTAKIAYVIVLSDTEDNINLKDPSSTEDVIGAIPWVRLISYIRDPRMEHTPLGKIPMVYPRVIADSQRLITVWSTWQQEESTFPIALVYDEFGSFQGIVRREDVSAALIHTLDQTLIRRYIRPYNDGYRVDGRCPIELFWQYMNWNLDTLPSGVETVAGWVGSLFAHIPRTGEKIQTDPWEIEVIRVIRNRIEEILIHPGPSHPEKSPGTKHSETMTSLS